MGSTHSVLMLNNKNLDPATCLGLCAADIVSAFFSLPPFSPSCVVGYRRAMVEKFNIQESFCTSLCNTVCCTACAMCQMQQELKLRGYAVKSICDSSPEATAELPPQPFGPHALSIAAAGVLGGRVEGLMMGYDNSICCANGCMPDCCDLFWCCPCAFGKVLTKLSNPTAFQPGETPCTIGDCCGVMCCPCAAAMGAQMQIQQRYYLAVSPFESALTALLCAPCVLCRVREEMNQRAEFPGGCCCTPQANLMIQKPNPAVELPIQQGYPLAGFAPQPGAYPPPAGGGYGKGV